MTNKEAIEWLKRIEERYILNGDEGFDKARKEALHMAIEALEQYEMAYEHGWTDAESKYREILEHKRGKWIQIEDADANGNAWYECPFCRKGDCHAVSQTVSYCWNCGADMRGEDD